MVGQMNVNFVDRLIGKCITGQIKRGCINAIEVIGYVSVSHAIKNMTLGKLM